MFFLSGKLTKRTQIIFARNNTHKGFSNCSSSSPKEYTVIHKTLITVAFSRRFRFVSVRRRFVICDLLSRERQIYRSFACEKSLSPLVYVAVKSVLNKTLSSLAQNFKYRYFCCLCENVSIFPHLMCEFSVNFLLD